MSLPYFPMYPTDFEAKTSHLTLAEDGAYNRLLRICWMTPGCSIPDDDAWIMRRLRVDQATFDAVVKVVISEFFTSAKGRLSNAKLTRIFVETNESHKRRVQAGSKGGKSKPPQTNNKSSSNAKAMPKQPEPEPEPDIREESTNVLLPDMPPPIDEVAKAVSAYNETAARVGWPSVQKLTPQRRSALKGRIKDAGGVDGWAVALEKAEASRFLRGESGNFRCTFDFLSKQANFTKLMEGNYDDRTNDSTTAGGTNQSRSGGAHHSLMAGFADVANRNR